MDPEKVKAALEAIKNGDSEAALALLEEMVASAAGGDADAPEGGDAPEGDALADEPADPPEDEDSMARLRRLTQDDPAAAQRLTQMETRLAEVERREAAREHARRVELVADLVKLGVELPSTAWEGEPTARKPVKRLSDEPIVDLERRVEVYRKARPAPVNEPPSVAPERDVTQLSAVTLARIKKAGLTPEEYFARRENAARRSA